MTSRIQSNGISQPNIPDRSMQNEHEKAAVEFRAAFAALHVAEQFEKVTTTLAAILAMTTEDFRALAAKARAKR